jgi:hypothetical protein
LKEFESDKYSVSENDKRFDLIRTYSLYADELLSREPQQKKIISPMMDIFFGHSFASVYRKQLHKYFVLSDSSTGGHFKLKFSEKMDIVLTLLNRMKEEVLKYQYPSPSDNVVINHSYLIG